MEGYHIVDLSLPIINGGGFGMPAQISYMDHRTRGKALAERVGISMEDIESQGFSNQSIQLRETEGLGISARFDSRLHRQLPFLHRPRQYPLFSYSLAQCGF